MKGAFHCKTPDCAGWTIIGRLTAREDFLGATLFNRLFSCPAQPDRHSAYPRIFSSPEFCVLVEWTFLTVTLYKLINYRKFVQRLLFKFYEILTRTGRTSIIKSDIKSTTDDVWLCHRRVTIYLNFIARGQREHLQVSPLQENKLHHVSGEKIEASLDRRQYL